MSIGIWQLVLILLIIFVLFGAGKLPSVMKDFGKSVKNLKDGLNGTDEQEPASASLKNVQAEQAKSENK